MYVYVMKAGEMCKIGIAQDVYKRKKQIQTGCPVKIEDCFYQDSKDARKHEIELHKLFKDKQTSGEWFDVDFDIACEEVTRIILEETYYDAFIRLTKRCNDLETENNDLKDKIGNKQNKMFMNINDTSKRLGISVFQIRQGVKNGTIPYTKCGNKYMINIDKYSKML